MIIFPDSIVSRPIGSSPKGAANMPTHRHRSIGSLLIIKHEQLLFVFDRKGACLPIEMDGVKHNSILMINRVWLLVHSIQINNRTDSFFK